MSKKPGDWWDKSWTLVEGCTWPEGKMPAACEECWARGLAKRFSPHQLDGVTLRHDRLDIPFKRRKPTVFACQINYGDLFHEEAHRNFILRAWLTMRQESRHTFVLLTKRYERARIMVGEWLLPSEAVATFVNHEAAPSNVYLLASVWDQESTDAACAAFSGLPVRWGLHIEPLLGPARIPGMPAKHGLIKTREEWHGRAMSGVDPYGCRPIGSAIKEDIPSWAVVGSENGPRARPFDLKWAMDIQAQCKAAGVPYWFKGSWRQEVPEEVMVREVPW